MKQRPYLPGAVALRRRAEARLRAQPKVRRAVAKPPQSGTGPRRLVHELQVHQIEMEMQNAELREARNRMEMLLEKYTDLYDFAPVGYFSLDEQGRILEVNLTGAALLGVERSRLLRQPMKRFMTPISRPTFLAFLQQVFAGTGRQVWEATLLKEGGPSFWASFHGTSAISVSGPQKWCRVAVSDITALKRAEETQRQAEALVLANRELEQEVVRRKAVEVALRQSELQQSRLLAQSHRMQDQLRHLSHEVLQAQEEERKRISRELHDEITQVLVALNYALGILLQEATINPRGLKGKIIRTQRLVSKSVALVHQFARRLRPPALDDLGLIPALKALLKDFSKRTGIRVQFTAFAEVERMSNAKRTMFYRVAHSALTNVALHAQAKGVRVTLQKQEDTVVLKIQDDGKGFNVEQALSSRGKRRLGLLSMRERVEMTGGCFAVKASPGKGTTIRAQVTFANGAR